MKSIEIKINKNGTCIPNSNHSLGITGENLQGNIVFKFCEDFINGIGYVDVKKPDGTLGYIQATKTENSYIIPIKSSLLNDTGMLKIQLRITQENIGDETPVFKSEIFNIPVHSAINAESVIPDEYPTWIDTANQALLEFETAIQQTENLDIDVTKEGTISTVTITKKDGTTEYVEISDGVSGADGEDAKINGYNTVNIIAGENVAIEQEDNNLTINSVGGTGNIDDVKVNGESVVTNRVANIDLTGYVEDDDYVHTDINYTAEDKAKLDGLSNYDDTEIRNELNDKVDKVDGKGLSTNDYTTEEKNKLAGIEAGAEVNAVDSVNGQTGTVVITVPTKTSDLNNDSGFISTETDPTVPSWAKETTKPSYNYDEIGNTPAIPTKTSDLLNDSGFVDTTDLATKQNVLTAGTNITIENDVISSTGGGGSVDIDNITITENANEEIQTVGVIDQKTTNANKFWTGTLAEYNAIAIKDNDTFYNITDDYADNGVPSGGTTGQVLTKNSNTDLDMNWVTPTEYRNNVETIINSDGTYTIASLEANKSYKLGEITALTISAVSSFDEESIIYFTSGTTATTVAIPTTLVNLGDVPELIDGGGSCEASKSYIIAVLNNIAVWKCY